MVLRDRERHRLSGKLYAWGDEFKPGGKVNDQHLPGVFPVKDTGEDGFAALRRWAPSLRMGMASTTWLETPGNGAATGIAHYFRQLAEGRHVARNRKAMKRHSIPPSSLSVKARNDLANIYTLSDSSRRRSLESKRCAIVNAQGELLILAKKRLNEPRRKSTGEWPSGPQHLGRRETFGVSPTKVCKVPRILAYAGPPPTLRVSRTGTGGADHLFAAIHLRPRTAASNPGYLIPGCTVFDLDF